MTTIPSRKTTRLTALEFKETDTRHYSAEQIDHGTTSGAVEVVFRNHIARLTQLIDEAKTRRWVCFGAVAWLTDAVVLDAMAQLPCLMLVQKEDFLRPDASNYTRSALRERYARIKGPVLVSNHVLPGVARELSNFSEWYDEKEAVRCVGETTRGGNKHRLMHNKFLVFASNPVVGYKTWPDAEYGCPPGPSQRHPKVVWTGSYNITHNASLSWENTLIVRDAKIAEAYLMEWAQLYAFSEPLDWEKEYIAPEYRMGT